MVRKITHWCVCEKKLSLGINFNYLYDSATRLVSIPPCSTTPRAEAVQLYVHFDYCMHTVQCQFRLVCETCPVTDDMRACMHGCTPTHTHTPTHPHTHQLTKRWHCHASSHTHLPRCCVRTHCSIHMLCLMFGNTFQNTVFRRINASGAEAEKEPHV